MDGGPLSERDGVHRRVSGHSEAPHSHRGVTLCSRRAADICSAVTGRRSAWEVPSANQTNTTGQAWHSLKSLPAPAQQSLPGRAHSPPRTQLRGPGLRDLIPDTAGLPACSQHLWKSGNFSTLQINLVSSRPGRRARLSPPCFRPYGWQADGPTSARLLTRAPSSSLLRSCLALPSCRRAFAPAGT